MFFREDVYCSPVPQPHALWEKAVLSMCILFKFCDFIFFSLSLHTVCLRIQSNPRNLSQFSISPERAFADFIFASIVLHLVVMNFIG